MKAAAQRALIRVVDLSVLYAEVGSSGGVRFALGGCFGGRSACSCSAATA